MPKYAEKTEVSSEKSRADIEGILRRYGATSFMYGWESNAAMLAFVMEGRQIRFVLPMPNPSDKEFTHTPARGTLRSQTERDRVYDQAVRQRWRALALVIKAKLEAVVAGISVFEDEFLANILLPDGQTVSRFMRPQIERAYNSGVMPSMLPMLGGGVEVK